MTVGLVACSIVVSGYRCESLKSQDTPIDPTTSGCTSIVDHMRLHPAVQCCRAQCDTQ